MDVTSSLQMLGERMTELLKDKIAVITGGSAGIGKAIALLFAQQGATVCLLSSSAEKGERAMNDIRQSSGSDRVTFFPVDVSQSQLVREVMDQIIKTHGRIDILVNNAGITRDSLLLRMTEEDWDRVMAVNVKSCFNTCHASVRPMIKARRGKIINITSIVGLTGNAGQVNYAASKAAIIGFTKSLAKELAGRQISVNCIAPGFIDTDMTRGLPEAWKEAQLERIPFGRLGQPEEIARVALFLASELSDYVTGQVLVVDGGMVM